MQDEQCETAKAGFSLDFKQNTGLNLMNPIVLSGFYRAMNAIVFCGLTKKPSESSRSSGCSSGGSLKNSRRLGRHG
jgi:hypothetical protein